jgi:hypothetical protein
MLMTCLHGQLEWFWKSVDRLIGGPEYQLVSGEHGKVSDPGSPTSAFDYSHKILYDSEHMNSSLIINSGKVFALIVSVILVKVILTRQISPKQRAHHMPDLY